MTSRDYIVAGAGTAGCVRRRLGAMSAGPVRDEEPSDPEVILRDLPERERAEFLRQYHEAVEAHVILLATVGSGVSCIAGG